MSSLFPPTACKFAFRAFVLGAMTFAAVGCGTQLQKLSGFRSSVGFSTLTATPSTVDFGTLAVGATSANRTVVFKNELVGGQGAGTIACGTPNLSNNTSFFVVSSDCGTLAQGEFCSVVVHGIPAVQDQTTSTLSLTCTDTRGASQTAYSYLRQFGTQIVLVVTPLVYDFGNINTGTNSVNQDFVFQNTGNLSATGCAVPTVSDTTNFTITADTCSTNNLSGGSVCTTSVRANPTTSGAHAATLSRTCTTGGTVATTTNMITVTGAAPSLAWTPLTHAFGNVNTGSNSGTQTFTLANSGNGPATGCSAATISDTTNFTITGDTCLTNNVVASGSCTLTVRGNPTTAGTKNATISRTCTVGGTVTTTASGITVVGVTPALAWTPLTHGFGTVNVGSNSSTQVFTLANSGGSAATGCAAPSITDTTNFTITADTCLTNDLAGAASCTVTIRSNPTTSGAKTTTLSRVCTVGGTISTTASGITTTGAAPSLAWDTLTYNFGNVTVGAQSATQVFTLENFGNASATGCSTPAIDDATNFTITAETCGTASLAAAGTCTVTVRANPTTSGAKTATLSRTCTVGGTPSTTTNGITTNAVQASLAWNPMTYDFGNINVASSSSTHTFTLSNTGAGIASSCAAPTLSNSTDFTITTDGCATSDVAATTGTCTVSIKGNPASSGAKATTLSRVCTVGGTATTTSNQIVVNGIAPILAFTPLTHDYGNVNVGANSADFTFNLANSGTALATGCTAATLSNSTDFMITGDNCYTNNLSTSGNCDVYVRANPASSGAKSTTLSRTCTFGGTATTTSNQIVVAGVAPSLAWTPLTKAFGSVAVGSSSSGQTFTLTNSGTATATGCSAPTIDDTTNFTLSSDTCGTNTLAGASATCTIVVTGNPTTAGAKAATLSRTCTYGGTATTTANQITVTGTTPSLAWTPLTKDFSSITVGTSSTGQTFTLTNSGTATATGCSAPTIDDTTNFTLSSDTCGTNTLAGSNATCTIVVTGSPTTTGAKTATLSRTCTFGGTVTTTTNQITVTGVSPTLAWSPLTNDFGSIGVSSQSSAVTFTLSNTGAGIASGCSAPVLGGTNANQFTIATDGCGTSNVAATSGTCTVTVKGAPTSAGVKNATLSRTCTIGGTPTTTADGLAVTGVIVPATITAVTTTPSSGDRVTGQNVQLNLTWSKAVTVGGTPQIAVTIGSTVRYATYVSGSGTTSHVYRYMVVDGDLDTDGIAVASPVDLNSGTIQDSGLVNATLTFTPPTTTSYTVNSAARVTWSLASSTAYSFPTTVSGGTSADVTFTLTNVGGTATTGCAAPSLGSTTNFTIVSNTCGTTNLAPADTCTITAHANPTAAGALSTTLSRTCTTGSSSRTMNVVGFTSAGSTCVGGTMVGGYCWLKTTSSSQSCDTLCQAKGGVHDATRFYAGSYGTDTQCTTIANALSWSGSINSYSGTTGDVGCGIGNTGSIYRLYSLPTISTTGANAGSGSRLACACGDGSAVSPAPAEFATFTSVGTGNSSVVLKATRGTTGATGIRIAYTTGATAPADCTTAQYTETNFTSGFDASGILVMTISGLTPSTQYSFRACTVIGSTLSAGKTVTDTTSGNDPAQLARAPKYSNSSQWVSSGPLTSITYAHTVPTGTDRFLLVVLNSGSASNVTSATYGGAALTHLAINNDAQDLYYMINPPVGTANVAFTFGSTQYSTSSMAGSYTGVHQTTPYSTLYTDVDYSSTVNMLTMKTGSAQSELVVGTIVVGQFYTAPTIQSVAIIDQTVPGTTTGGSHLWHQAGDAKVLFQWNSSYYYLYSISLKPSAP